MVFQFIAYGVERCMRYADVRGIHFGVRMESAHSIAYHTRSAAHIGHVAHHVV